ncbi:MAG: wax ester/triacylglycerol synthase family O-acyltransferase [Pseudomonadota bacterium]
MQQLTEMDSNFLQQESVRTPLHISPVIVYDQSARREGRVRFKEILTVFERNLHKSSIFRRKLAGGAMGLDTPYWVEDPHFDLEFHVRHLALPKPGDWRQFCILLARLHSRGLDMQRPLWEAYVIEGLSGVEGLPQNSFAIMLKIHHAAIDGVSGAEILTAIHSLTDEIEPPTVEDNWQGESDPSAWQVWSRAYVKNLRRPVKFFETMGTLVPAAIRVSRDGSKEDHEHEKKPAAGKTRFNARISSARVTDSLFMRLEDLKAIRKTVADVTINDIIVTIVSGALRRYLQDKGELPEQSLSCGAPINTRSERNSSSTGNQISIMTIDMATDVADPLERLLAIHEYADHSKEVAGRLGKSMILDVSEVFAPQVMSWSFQAATLAISRTNLPMPFHVMISNVPGPQFDLYLAGARVHTMMGIGPLAHMMGLFHAVTSGAGQIVINFVACREMLPDPDFYQQCLAESYAELQEAVAQQTTKAASRRSRSRTKSSQTRNKKVAR